MEQFKSFITEAKNEDYKVVVLSVEHGDKSITAKRIKEEAVKLGLSNYVIGINGSHIEFNDGTYSLHELGDRASDTAVKVHVDDGASAELGTAATSSRASSEGGPASDLAVNGAAEGIASERVR